MTYLCLKGHKTLTQSITKFSLSICRNVENTKTDVIPAILSRNFVEQKIASLTLRVAQLFNSRATSFPNRAMLCSVKLCRENAVDGDWSILVYATKLHSCILQL